MKVELINYTQDARELLLLTKLTRLSNESGAKALLAEIKNWTDEKKNSELAYMLRTIESSWEFVIYTFAISGISRSFTHQLVRTRGEEKTDVSYAQQSQRTVPMSGFEYVRPKSIEVEPQRLEHWINSMQKINELYQEQLEMGTPVQDARDLLPNGVHTQIICKFDLRTLNHMMSERMCCRTQGPYQEVAKLMRKEILEVHPWVEDFLQCYCVDKGICRFPNFNECPIKGIVFNPDSRKRFMDSENYNATDPIIPERMRNDDSEDSQLPADRKEVKWAWNEMNNRGGFSAIPKVQGK